MIAPYSYLGNFLATGAPILISADQNSTAAGTIYDQMESRFNPGFDWIRVYNMTTMGAAGAGTGVEFFWTKGFPVDTGIEYRKTAVTDALAPRVLANGGFTEFTSEVPVLSAPVAIAAGILAGPPPVVQTANTAGLYPGDVVKVSSVVGGRQLEGGIDYTVGVVNNNADFQLVNMPAIIACAAPGAAAVWRKVMFPTLYQPRVRYIASITLAANAVVTFTTNHTFIVGQRVTMTVPPAYGMVQMNGIKATITAIGAATITLNVNSAAFTAFAFPLNAAAPFTPAVVELDGAAATSPAAYGGNIEVGQRGIILAPGVDSPGGTAGDALLVIGGYSYQY
jgi:hypothetical protein